MGHYDDLYDEMDARGEHYRRTGSYPPAPVKPVQQVKRLSVEAQLLAALKALFKDYKSLADSGDAGNWALEDTPAGQYALAAIARAEKR